MAGNITFTIIKPSAVRNGYTGPILAKIHEAGFKLIAMKYLHLSLKQIQDFYKIHNGKAFYEKLVDYMSSGPVVLAILEKENAVEEYRKLLGSTDPVSADEGSLRKLFGTGLPMNGLHGSDSDENAVIEADYFFSKLERFHY